MKRSLIAAAVVLFAFVVGIGARSAVESNEPGPLTKTIRGTYGFGYTGTVFSPSPLVGPIAGTGVLVADGAGKLTGSETFNVNGTVCNGNFSGTYSVNADATCSVSATFAPVTAGCPSGTFDLSCAVTDSGLVVKFSQLDPSKVVAGEARRFRLP